MGTFSVIVLIAFSIYGVIALCKAMWQWASNNIAFNESKFHLTVMGHASEEILKSAFYVYETYVYNICIPFNSEQNFKYLGVFIDKRKEAAARTRALYAATHRCCSGPNFQAQLCLENIDVLYLKYVYIFI